jgi:hypothetical protein
MCESLFIRASNFSGGLEMHNLDMNVDVIQDYMATVAPFIQVERAVVKQLRVTVC